VDGSVANVDFEGNIRTPGISNSLTDRPQNSRKSKFATDSFGMYARLTGSGSNVSNCMSLMSIWRLSSRAFVLSDIADLPRGLQGAFDIVFTSYGVIPWLTDLGRWGT
jgi:hypothetical protein